MRFSTRYLLILLVLLVIAGVLAIPMRETVYNIIILPIAYIGWVLGLLYKILPQVLLWWLLVAVIFFLLLFSMLPSLKINFKQKSKPKPRRGQVEDLALWMGRAKSGVYFKWLVANRLGKLAYQILLHRENGRPRTVFTPLLGEDWQPPSEMRVYLETGLHGSFSDFPNTKSGMITQKTPLDYELKDVVEFLETKMENDQRSSGDAPA